MRGWFIHTNINNYYSSEGFFVILLIIIDEMLGFFKAVSYICLWQKGTYIAMPGCLSL